MPSNAALESKMWSPQPAAWNLLEVLIVDAVGGRNHPFGRPIVPRLAASDEQDLLGQTMDFVRF
jgi:hypothetical protein